MFQRAKLRHADHDNSDTGPDSLVHGQAHETVALGTQIVSDDDVPVIVEDPQPIVPVVLASGSTTQRDPAGNDGLAPAPLTSAPGGGNDGPDKSDKGNAAPRARFGRRRTHNEQLCVATCGVITGRATFYGSEAVSGHRVRLYTAIQIFALCSSLIRSSYEPCIQPGDRCPA